MATNHIQASGCSFVSCLIAGNNIGLQNHNTILIYPQMLLRNRNLDIISIKIHGTGIGNLTSAGNTVINTLNDHTGEGLCINLLLLESDLHIYAITAVSNETIFIFGISIPGSNTFNICCHGILIRINDIILIVEAQERSNHVLIKNFAAKLDLPRTKRIFQLKFQQSIGFINQLLNLSQLLIIVHFHIKFLQRNIKFRRKICDSILHQIGKHMRIIPGLRKTRENLKMAIHIIPNSRCGNSCCYPLVKVFSTIGYELLIINRKNRPGISRRTGTAHFLHNSLKILI